MNIENFNRRLIIKEIFNNDNIKYPSKPDITSFRVDESLSSAGGVYKISCDNIVYIGQTKCFKDRFLAHRQNYHNNHAKTQYLLKQGGTFEVIAVEEDLEKRIEAESFYIEQYSNNKDYKCINERGKQKNKNETLYKNIRVSNENYEEAVKLLRENGYI